MHSGKGSFVLPATPQLRLNSDSYSCAHICNRALGTRAPPWTAVCWRSWAHAMQRRTVNKNDRKWETYHCGGVGGIRDTPNHQADHVFTSLAFLHCFICLSVSRSPVLLGYGLYTGIGFIAYIYISYCFFDIAYYDSRIEITGWCLTNHYTVHHMTEVNFCRFVSIRGRLNNIWFRKTNNCCLHEHIVIPIFLFSNKTKLLHRKHRHTTRRWHQFYISDSRTILHSYHVLILIKLKEITRHVNYIDGQHVWIYVYHVSMYIYIYKWISICI